MWPAEFRLMSIAVLSICFCASVTALQKPKISFLPAVIKLHDTEGQPVLDYLNKTIDNLHSLFVNGIPELGVAPFDPIDLGSLHVASFASDSTDVSDASADVSDLVWTGLSNFKLDDLEFHIATLSGKLHLSWPEKQINGVYSASGLVSGQPATASGDLKIDMVDIVLNSSVALYLNGTTPQISSLTLGLFLGKSAVTLSNLVGDVQLQDAFQVYVQDLVDEIYGSIVNSLDALAEELADVLNQLLSHIGQNGIESAPGAVYSLGHRLAFKLGFAPH